MASCHGHDLTSDVALSIVVNPCKPCSMPAAQAMSMQKARPQAAMIEDTAAAASSSAGPPGRRSWSVKSMLIGHEQPICWGLRLDPRDSLRRPDDTAGSALDEPKWDLRAAQLTQLIFPHHLLSPESGHLNHEGGSAA